MRKPTLTDEADALLAGGRLGGPARERILNRVLAAVEPPAARMRRIAGRLLLGLAPGAAVVAVLVFALPHRRSGAPTCGGALRAKGTSAMAVPAIDPICDGEIGACRVGQHLYFRVDRVARRSWLAAYAEPADGWSPPGQVWMFPTDDQIAPELPVASTPSILRRAIDLGAGMAPGRYRLTMIVFDHPPTRAEASEPGARGIRIVRSLVIR
jgi:hypothetical protein